MKFFIFFATQILLFYSVHAAESSFSVNDLSILFPMENASKMKFPIHVDTPDWRILSVKNFAQVIAGAKTQNVYINDKLENPQNWMLVAMRYTPCNLLAGTTNSCVEQIRFVYQPLNVLEFANGFDDYAIHVVFNYETTPDGKITSRLDSFRKVKNQFPMNLDQPLNVSPLLQTNNGAQYLNALKAEVIDPHVSTRSPSKVTFMGLQKLASAPLEVNRDGWVFFSGDIDSTNSWILTLLPTSAKFQSQSLTADDETGAILSSIKVPKAEFSLFGKANENANAMAILNINQTNDHNVDCASCHIADRFIFTPLIEDSQLFLSQTSWMIQDQSRISEVLIDRDIHVGQRSSEFPIPRIFGYLDTTPAVSQRVVLDTAFAVRKANELYSLPVNKQCSNEDAKRKVMACLYVSDQKLDACMKQYCP